MASWKEKGVVPDSDDEGEVESQSTGLTHNINDWCGISIGQLQGLDNEAENGNEADGAYGALFLSSSAGEKFLAANDASGSQELGSPNQTLPGTRKEMLADVDKSAIPSSPASPRTFRIPELFLNFEENASSQAREERSGTQNSNWQQHSASPRPSEEISKSYVRITSGGSSPLSSPPESLSSPRPDSSWLKIDVPDLHSALEGAAPIDRTLQDLNRPIAAKRSFRQRNLNQIYPYHMELEKYRRELKGRGVLPTLIAESQGRRRSSQSPEGDSQTHETQELESDWGISGADESQMLGLTLDNPSSSAIESLQVDDGASDVLTGSISLSDDEEFPDINDLLRQRPLGSSRLRLKRRTYSNSSKAKRQRLSMAQTHSPARAFRLVSSSAFDILVSPPATSPPILGNSSRQQTPHETLSLSRATGLIRHASHERDARASTDLPTPATSAVKPGTISVNSESEDANVLTNNLDDDRSVSESSSDESMHFRRIGKRIRGVLPASHLRLDTQKQKHIVSRPSFRDSASLSPARVPNRRGIAVPRATRDGDQVKSTMRRPIPILELSDGMSDDNEYESRNFVDRGSPLERGSILTQSRLGYADEVDNIDAMLPTRNRLTLKSSHRPKKSKVGSVSRKAPGTGKAYKQRSTITGHLERLEQGNSDEHDAERQQTYLRQAGRRKRGSATHERSAHVAPRLGILDVIESENRQELPQFIRIAARAASSHRGQGRQNLSGKYIRLATQKDTQDVQLILQHWREGKIQPKDLPISTNHFMPMPLQRIENNRQTQLRSPVRRMRPEPYTRAINQTSMPKKLLVSKVSQRSMNDFVVPAEYGGRPQERVHGRNITRGGQFRQHKNFRKNANLARPAQLESTGMDFPAKYPDVSFRSSKKVLDTLYRASRKLPVGANLPMSRFLADDDLVRHSIETPIPNGESDKERPGSRKQTRPNHLKKRIPRRIDADAAIYRQPSNPLILESFESKLPHDDPDSTLQGLGKYGTNYPVNFGVFPLQLGVFFHQTTYIGSGQFAEAMSWGHTVRNDDDERHQKFTLGNKQFCWGPWDANVSSEIGVCFDWVFDQLVSKNSLESNPQAFKPIDVIISVQKYMQRIAKSMTDTCLENFMSRMQEVLQEFISRLDPCQASPECDSHLAVEVLERCAVIAYQLVSLSRATPCLSSMILKLEDLLQMAAGKCIDWLVSQGLSVVRKLYDDLQYLSFRDGGIRSTQFVAHSWVVIIKVLNAAQIPKGMFWDIANPHLLDENVQETKDARSLEKMWYSLFSILPLFDFDDFGVLTPGSYRQASANWQVPQQILKRVFALYRSNQKQSPSFNGYCRTLVHRCHYLVVEWGWWKCSSLIGTLFDFFASQKLAHLRNEEVYSSPRFLEELNLEPSLAVEPEDRCFHIFLKLVALGIKHFKQVDDIKSIRNLVARLLPNHDRQYPKEEAIHHRDLASLRNHHDLLCTLYWAAPPQQRPSLSLIQELVIADHSHKEACLINMRAWENLARFTVTRPPSTESFTPLAVWRRVFFEKLWQQLLNTKSEVQQQADSLAIDKSDATWEAKIQQLIAENIRTTSAELVALLQKTITVLPIATSLGIAKEVFDSDLILIVLNRGVPDEMMSAAIRVVELFLERIAADDQTRQHMTSSTEDSQDSLDVNMDQWEAFHELKLSILPALSDSLRGIIETSNSKASDITIRLVTCWARLVTVLAEEDHLKIIDFLVDGPRAIFKNRNTFQYEHHLWITALHVVIKFCSSVERLTVPGFDLGREWLVILTKPMDARTRASAYELQTLLRSKGHYLLPSVYDGENLKPNEAVSFALNVMRRFVHESDSTATGSRATGPITKAELSTTVKVMLESMRLELERADVGSVAHLEYVAYVQHIIAAIRAYANHIQPVSQFFLHPSSYYWPQEADPQLFGAGILSYSLQLSGKDAKKVSSQLFHFLLNGLRQSYLHGQVEKHGNHLQMGTKNWEFTAFVLVEVLPLAIHTAFNGGPWILGKVYLPVAANRVVKLLRMHGAHATLAFNLTLNVLQWIIRSMQEYLDGILVNRQNIEGILGLSVSFWQVVGPAMVAFSQSCDFGSTPMKQYQDSFEALLHQLCTNSFKISTEAALVAPATHEPMKGSFFESFKEALKSEMADWQMGEDDKWVDIKSVGAHGELWRVPLSQPTLREVLARGDHSALHSLSPPIPFVGQVWC